ncbi:MAG: hypothetical protein PHR77_04900 [Kiritimatiellae bacterium]|nr:hypothetical protein [Kiritimatiellia bacterium]MDD5523010.1 hypothetical protein [Kiritimatiellia bacterium]
MKRSSPVLIIALALFPLISTQLNVFGQAQRDQALFDTMYTGKYLYTAPDLSLGGGLKGEVVVPKGKVTDPKKIVLGIFALPPHEPKFVYKGVLSGEDNRSFEFRGLPPALYDIFIAFENEVYEGLTLNRFKNSLTEADRKSIEYIINKSDKFFEMKVIHRMSGITGKKTGYARAIVSMIRIGATTDMAGHSYTAHKRNYKLVFLEDVGPGYQVARTRDVFSRFIASSKDVPDWNYRPYLSGIRVTDTIKDLGIIDLSIPGEEKKLSDPVDEINPEDTVPRELEIMEIMEKKK